METVAGRFEQESKRLGAEDGETLARALDLRVAALMVRDEAKVAVREAADVSRVGGDSCVLSTKWTKADCGWTLAIQAA